MTSSQYLKKFSVVSNKNNSAQNRFLKFPYREKAGKLHALHHTRLKSQRAVLADSDITLHQMCDITHAVLLLILIADCVGLIC